ncbi:uncharacterized protein LOC126743627 isoform X2 [Anthonomus grandis grandis]|uniref:uncharacterized protein LOC126743627 isoform X2 n=1 Tax=Anthonomus grandis grandis TaxID=2921223 RepID=UPI0021651A6F|nr:uncharacterized protein LOC126743627 isoform X2 [Anthonomus grandis grandis]
MRYGNSVGFPFLVFLLLIAVCRCGLLNLFDEWANAIQPKRFEGVNPVEYVGKSNPLFLDSPLMAASRFSSLEKRKSINHDEISCDKNDMACINNLKCMECQKFCQASEPKPDDNQILDRSPRFATTNKKDEIFSKIMHPVATYKEGETKEIISRIAGIKNLADVESVIVWVTTYSNKPPKILGGILPENTNNELSPVDEKLITTTQKENLNLRPEMKLRSSDYDDTNDLGFVEKSSISNPNVIEGPPPFMRSSSDINNAPLGQSAPKEAENIKDEKGSKLDSPTSGQIMVQPKEFQPDEANEDDLVEKQNALKNKLNDLKNFRSPLKTLKSNTRPSKGGFFQNLFLPRNAEIISSKSLKKPTVPVVVSRNSLKNNTPGKSDFNDALKDVKNMLKSMQEDAKKSTEERLLGATHPPEHLIHKAFPPHVVANVKDVNKYLIDRAQDALDTIGTSDNDINSNTGKHEHSQVTKDIITNFKRMPQYLLGKLKDTFDGLEKVSKPIIENQKLGISGRTAEDANNLNDNDNDLIGAPAQIVQTTTAIPAKSKWEIYQEKLKERRQKMYSPEKYLNRLNDKPSLFKATEESKRKGENLTNKNLFQPFPVNTRNAATSATDLTLGEALTTKSPNKSILLPTIPTKDKLINYLNNVKSKSQSTTNNSVLDPLELKNNKDFGQSLLGVIDPVKEEAKPALKDKLKNLVEDMAAKTNLMEEKVKQRLANIKKPLASQKIDASEIRAEEHSSLLNKSEKPVTIKPDEPNNFVEETRNSEGLAKPLDSQELQTSGSLVGADEPPKFIETTVQDDLSKGEILKDNLKNYFEDMRTKTTAKIDEANAKIEDNVRQYMENLKKPIPKQEIQPFVSATEPVTRDNILKLIENTKLENKRKDLKSPFINQPSVHNEILKPNNFNKGKFESIGAEPDKKSLLRNRLRNFVDDLKSRSSLLSNRFGELSKDRPNKNLLADKLKDLTEGLKKPLDVYNMPRLGAAKSENIIADSNLKESEPKKASLREKMKAYVDSLGNIPRRMPDVQRPNTAAEFIRPSMEKSDDEKSAVKNSLDTVKKLPDDKNLETSVSSPLDNEKRDNDNIVLGSRSDFKEEDAVKEWANSLGQIVQYPSNPKDIFFLGNGVKLPLKISHGTNGSMDLSVDLEKLCSCHNSTTCPANQTSIDETVGTILEKEAELKEKLGNENVEKVKKSNGLLNKMFKRSVSEDILKTTYDKTVEQLQKGAKSVGDEIAKNIILKNPTSNLASFVHKTDNLGSKFLKEPLLNKIDNSNNIPDINEMIKKYEKDRIMKKMLTQMGTIQKNLDPQEDLKKLTKELEQTQTDISNKIEENLENLQNQVKMPDWYQNSKINLLKNKLKQLDEKVSQYNTENADVLTKRILWQRPNKVVEKELNIIRNIFDWISGFGKSDK